MNHQLVFKHRLNFEKWMIYGFWSLIHIIFMTYKICKSLLLFVQTIQLEIWICLREHLWLSYWLVPNVFLDFCVYGNNNISKVYKIYHKDITLKF